MSKNKEKCGFSLIEMMIAMTIMSMFGAAFIAFIKFSYEPLFGVMDEANKNRMGSYAVVLMTQKIREANDHQILAGGDELKLQLDGHQETFKYDSDEDLIFRVASPDHKQVLVKDVKLMGSEKPFQASVYNDRLIKIQFAIESRHKNRSRTINVATSVLRIN